MKKILEKIVRSSENILDFIKDNAKIGVMLIAGGAGNVAYASKGYLCVINHLDNVDYSKKFHETYHEAGASEAYIKGEDRLYDALFNPSGITSKIVSIVEPNELERDKRPFGNKYINLELSIHSEFGAPIIVSNLENKLICDMTLVSIGYDFGTKPITIQQQDLSDLNNDGNVDFYDFAILANDYGKTGNALAGDISGADGISDGHVGFYDVAYFSGGWSNKRAYPVYDIRRAINAQGENTGVIPIPNLDGTYISEKPYANFQLRFDRFLSDLNEDGLVNLLDFGVLGAEWGKTDVNSVADISGPNGIPDRKVDWFDMKAFREDYLKDISDPNTWSKAIKAIKQRRIDNYLRSLGDSALPIDGDGHDRQYADARARAGDRILPRHRKLSNRRHKAVD